MSENIQISKDHARASENQGENDLQCLMVYLGTKVQIINSEFKDVGSQTRLQVQRGGEDYIKTGEVNLHSPDLIGEIITFGAGYSGHPNELIVMDPKTRCVVSGYEACLKVVEEAIDNSLRDAERGYVQDFYDHQEELSATAAKFASDYHASFE